ncbi:MAG: type II toxin-antitoxin system RelE/ParE family toxin [Nanoarchaeota archaeon]|nr:type II toxin-antitoxin system RelE/ParE family toxin [Nanoarchaeota archaeon]
MYSLSVKPEVDKKFEKIRKKNSKQFKIILKKIEQVVKNPHHFKPLRGDMHGVRRVHVGSFVLTYEIDEEKKVITILDYDHHDKIY